MDRPNPDRTYPMRYLLILLLIYLTVRVGRNLIRAVRGDGGPSDRTLDDRYPDLDIEEAEWEDIE